MPKILTVQNAEIHTTKVEIQTLTISGKQVTLAVFRQLKEDNLIDENGNFRGLPWGSVNYHPDKCDDGSAHLHIIWQYGNELRRSKVKKPLFPDYLEPKSANEYFDSEVIFNDYRIDRGQIPYRHLYKDESCKILLNLRYMDLKIITRYTRDHLAICEYRNGEHEFRKNRDIQYKDAIERLRSNITHSPENLRELLSQEVESILEYRKRMFDRWDELCTLPQLFIAI